MLSKEGRRARARRGLDLLGNLAIVVLSASVIEPALRDETMGAIHWFWAVSSLFALGATLPLAGNLEV
jgi:hypothetical protein